MNYKEIVDYIEELPSYTKKHPLTHTRELLLRLGNPQEHFKVIHVAGTNGKGSVCAYLASMLREGGCRTGFFTSPHLVTINERFQIDGELISDEKFAEAFLRVKKVIDGAEADGYSHPSYFETLFLMAMDYFAREAVEYVVLETGLGGLRDCTNAIEKPTACIITSISRDHMEYLGSTKAEIAAEKAGIIKPGVPVIYDGHVPDVSEVIERRAQELHSPSYALTADRYRLETQDRDGITFTFQGTRLHIPYIAQYQMMNASLAFFTMKKLSALHGVSEEKLVSGIQKIRWPGRMETVLPGVIVDGAHNEDGVAQFVHTVKHFRKDNRIIILFSAVADKQYEEMIRLICEEIRPHGVVATQVGGYREIPAEKLAELFRAHGEKNVTSEPDVAKALQAALALQQDGMVFCVGSLYLVGEIKAALEKR